MWRRLLFVVFFVSATSIEADWVTPSERVENRVSIRSEPVAGSARAGYLAAGERAELIDTLPYWYEIALPDSGSGYVSRAWTTVIGDADVMAIAAEMTETTDFAVHIVDVGTGDGILIDVGDQEILIDGGWDKTPFNTYLTKHDLIQWPVELVVVTHADYDHWSGLRKVLGLERDTLPNIVKEFWEPGYDRDCNELESYQRFLADMRRIPGIAIRRPLEDDFEPAVHSRRVDFVTPLSTPNVRLAVLHSDKAPPLITNCAYQINDASIVILLEVDTYRFLLTGDANGKEYTVDTLGHVEKKLLDFADENPGALSVDVLKVPHHGSESASATSFINAVRPTFAVISASTRHHLPRSTVVERYEDAGATVLRTDINVKSGLDHIICYPTAEGTVDCNYRSVLFPNE